MPTEPTTIDEFLARLDADKRAALAKLRRDVHAAAPEVEEVISYGMPGFKLDGRMLVWMGVGAAHCAFYPTAAPIALYARELSRYETSKGTIRFAPSEPLPTALVKKLVRARVAAVRAAAGAKKKAKRAKEAPATRAARAPAKRGRKAPAKRTPKAAAKRTPKAPAKRVTKRGTTGGATTSRGARNRTAARRRGR